MWSTPRWPTWMAVADLEHEQDVGSPIGATSSNTASDNPKCWLEAAIDDLGVRSSVDIRGTFL
jgi:hypothetical protein